MFVTRERANQRSDRDAVSLVWTNSHYKEEVVVRVQQKSPWLYPYSYPCAIAYWTSLQLENTLTIEINTDWKTATNLQYLHFHRPEKAIKLAKKNNNKDQRNLKRNYKTLFKVKCISFLKEMPYIEHVHYREFLAGNVSWDREVSVITCPLRRGFVMRVWVSFHAFLRKVSVVERCPL